MKEPKDYYEAARERLDQARFLFDVPQEDAERALHDKRYALVVYAAGVAVEAMLRGSCLSLSCGAGLWPNGTYSRGTGFPACENPHRLSSL